MRKIQARCCQGEVTRIPGSAGGRRCASPSPSTTPPWWRRLWHAAGRGLRSRDYFCNPSFPSLPLHPSPLQVCRGRRGTERGASWCRAPSGWGGHHPARAPLCAPPGSAQTLPTLSTPAFPCVTHASRLSAALTNEFQFLLSPKIATEIPGTSPVPGRRRVLKGHSAGTVSSTSCRMSPRGFKTKFKTNLPLGQAPSPLQANRQQRQH